jgi:hypothetical protein
MRNGEDPDPDPYFLLTDPDPEHYQKLTFFFIFMSININIHKHPEVDPEHRVRQKAFMEELLKSVYRDSSDQICLLPISFGNNQILLILVHRVLPGQHNPYR